MVPITTTVRVRLCVSRWKKEGYETSRRLYYCITSVCDERLRRQRQLLGFHQRRSFERLRSSDIGTQLSQAALHWAVHLASCLRSYVLLRTHGASWELSAATSEPYAYTLKEWCVGYNGDNQISCHQPGCMARRDIYHALIAGSAS